MKKIGVFTSGGDSPGMNAAIRAVFKACAHYGAEAVGIYRGFNGMIEGQSVTLSETLTEGIIRRGGTILKSARSEAFHTSEGRKKAYEFLSGSGIEGLVAIGGDGTYRGVRALREEFNLPAIGIPGTIDNDLYGTEYTLGYDTAVNTAVECMDRIMDTAESHDRMFFVEVMGRDAGFIALHAGMANGAGGILIPEDPNDWNELYATLEKRGKAGVKEPFLVVVSEGEKEGKAFELAEQIKAEYRNFDIRVSVLGHVQRGGAPTWFDRVLGGKLGVKAVEALLSGKTDLAAGIKGEEVVFTPFEQAVKLHRIPDEETIRISKILR
jgi:6-phosphofructokinase 1